MTFHTPLCNESAYSGVSGIGQLTRGAFRIKDLLRNPYFNSNHRAAHLLKESQLQTTSWRGCFLAANAMFQANNIEEAFKILEANEALFEQKKIETDTKDNAQSKDWLVALLVLKGKVLENMDNREQARTTFS